MLTILKFNRSLLSSLNKASPIDVVYMDAVTKHSSRAANHPAAYGLARGYAGLACGSRAIRFEKEDFTHSEGNAICGMHKPYISHCTRNDLRELDLSSN